MFESIFLQNRAFEGRNSLALAYDIQGDALTNFAFGIAIRYDRLIAVGMHIDKSRCDNVAFRRDGAHCRLRRDLTDMRNLAVFYGKIAVKPRIPGAVDQPAAVNDNVELRHFVLLKNPLSRLYHRISEATRYSAQLLHRRDRNIYAVIKTRLGKPCFARNLKKSCSINAARR